MEEQKCFTKNKSWKIVAQTDNIGYLIGELSQNVKISLQTFSDAFKNK